MVLFKLLLLTLTFYELIADLDARTCPKGQRVNRFGTYCEPCPNGYYQPEENDSKSCNPCTRCDQKSGSVVIKECTEVTDTKCQCRENFVAWPNDLSTCKCDIGFELKNGACLKCEDGYFSTRINSLCRKWMECKLGVNISGTRTSDVICNVKSNPDITTPYMTRLTTHRPHAETHLKNILTTTTEAPPRHAVTREPTRETESFPPSNPGNHFGMAIVLFGVIGLLGLTAVTCRLHSTPCAHRKPGVQSKDSCRRPVEEIGDGSQSSLKLNPGEP
ncbi:tumor necrosis factor receptor superfamily member 4 [Toxotes jaculatrix]|uniref:tumor necrosis factor receptor superfamily member 4 n=1 Tax=Toxotes jaculatrix TaxID=941984 RepID=UPI001B3AE5CA|nr:tumor necrosis factor receptor superfamily member 4 [Toxotes jaculatrix]